MADTQQDIWNPVEAIKKKYPAMGLSDQQIYQNLSDPNKFRSAFPEYNKMSDDDIKTGISKFSSKYAVPESTSIWTSPQTPSEKAAAAAAQAQNQSTMADLTGPVNIAPRKDVKFDLAGAMARRGAVTPEQSQEVKERVKRAYQSSVVAYGLRSQKNPYVGERGPSGEVEKLFGNLGELADPGTRERGALETISNVGTVSNANLGIAIAATGGFLGPIAPLTTRILSTLAGAGFTAQMATGLYRTNEEYKKAVDSGDLDKAREIQGSMMVQGALTALSAYGTYKAGTTPSAQYKGSTNLPIRRGASTLPEHHEVMSSLLEPRTGKENTYRNAEKITDDVRNEASRQGLDTDKFNGREGNELGAKLIDDTVKSHTKEIDSLKDPHLGDTRSMRPMAKAIRDNITDEMRNDAPELARKLDAEAEKLDRDGTIKEIDDFRDRVGDDLNSYYKKGPNEQLASGAMTKALEAAVRKSREILYEHVGNKEGVDPAYMRNLANKEADLIEARNDINKKVAYASHETSQAKVKSFREKVIGVEGKFEPKSLPGRFTDVMAQKILGMSPVDVLNARFKKLFGKLGEYKPYQRPPAPGGVPPIGPDRPMLPAHPTELGPSSLDEFKNRTVRDIINDARLRAMNRQRGLPAGEPPATQLGPSSLPEQKLLGTGSDVTLHQPPVDVPGRLDEAGKYQGRTKRGQFKTGYTSGPSTPQEEPIISQHPGVLTKPAPDTITPKTFQAILDDIGRMAQQRPSPQSPVTVKDSVFKHIQDAQKAIDLGEGEIIPPEDDPFDEGLGHGIYDPTLPSRNINETIEGKPSPKELGAPKSVSGGAPVETEKRGKYPDLRKALETEIEKLKSKTGEGPSELEKDIYFNQVTNMPNGKAFKVAEEQNGPAKAYGRSDSDGLKIFNDTYGHAAGNVLLRAKAEALQEAGLEAYHTGGDEFDYRGDSQGEIRTKLENARRILRSREFEVTDQETGEEYILSNLDFSYGTGKNIEEADAAQYKHKREREARGERGRGKLGSIIRTPKRP